MVGLVVYSCPSLISGVHDLDMEHAGNSNRRSRNMEYAGSVVFRVTLDGKGCDKIISCRFDS